MQGTEASGNARHKGAGDLRGQFEGAEGAHGDSLVTDEYHLSWLHIPYLNAYVNM